MEKAQLSQLTKKTTQIGGKEFHLGDVKKHRFLRGFGLQEGAGAEKIAS